MDALQRKKEWIHVEDDLFEAEVKWEWLLNKIKNKRHGNFDKTGNSLSATVFNSENLEKESELLNNSMKHSRVPSICTIFPAVNYVLATSDIHEALYKFVSKVLIAIQETNHEMTSIKTLIWNNWEDENITDTFYDSIQYTRQLQEVLTNAWTLTVNIYCFQMRDVACRAEKVVALISCAHELVTQLLKSGWHNFNHSAKKDDFFKAVEKGRARCHSVGMKYSLAIVEGHNVTLMLSEMLKEKNLLNVVHNEKEIPKQFDMEMSSYENNFSASDYKMVNRPLVPSFKSNKSESSSYPTRSSGTTRDDSSQQCSCGCMKSCKDSNPPINEHSNDYSKPFPAKFEENQWNFLINDFQDLKMEWTHIVIDFTEEDLKQNLIVKLKPIVENEQTVPVCSISSQLHEAFLELASCHVTILDSIRFELEQQRELWLKRQSQGFLYSHVKGLDPNEALFQAKSLFEQHFKAFFSLLFLLKSCSHHRIVNYASLICDRLAQARTCCYYLLLCPEIAPDFPKLNLPCSKTQSGSDSQSNCSEEESSCRSKRVPEYIVNPHKVPQSHALALANAHKFFDLILESLMRPS